MFHITRTNQYGCSIGGGKIGRNGGGNTGYMGSSCLGKITGGGGKNGKNPYAFGTGAAEMAASN